MMFHNYIKRPGGQSLVWSFSMHMYSLFGQCLHQASTQEKASVLCVRGADCAKRQPWI